MPRAWLRQAIRPEALEWLERACDVQKHPLCDGDAHPCRTPRGACAMKLHQEEGLIAVCGLSSTRCHDERIEPDDAFLLEFDDRSCLPMLQRSLGLPQRPARQGDVWQLGEHLFGQTRVGFVFAPKPHSDSTRFILEHTNGRDRPRVVLVFDRRDLPPEADWKGETSWMALSDATPSHDSLVFDLFDLRERYAPGSTQGHELWPRFLVCADPQHDAFWYAGQRLELPQDARRLLTLLLMHPRQRLSRQVLLPRLFPSHFSGRVDLHKLGEKLRKGMVRLRESFAVLQPRDGVSLDPFGTERSLDDTAGGYWIDVRADQIRWLSSPSADLADL